jgi:hypothetical protein
LKPVPGSFHAVEQLPVYGEGKIMHGKEKIVKIEDVSALFTGRLEVTR